MIVAGAVLVALLALLIEWLGRVLELRRPTEGGLSDAHTAPPDPSRRSSRPPLQPGPRRGLQPADRRRLRARRASSPARSRTSRRLDGAEIAVGSKNFTENVLLGKIAIILLQVGRRRTSPT